MTLRVAVVGVGAIGGIVAAALTDAGQKVMLLARGPRAAEIEADGLCVRDGDGHAQRYRLPLASPGSGAQNIVILAVKSDALPGAVQAAAPLVGSETIVIPLVNGVPWWYFMGSDRPARTVCAVDPGGKLRNAIPADRICGSVVYITAARRQDGVVQDHGMRRLVLGMIDGRADPLLDELAAALRIGAIATTVTASIRNALWTKIALNLATNPLSVVSGATLEEQFHAPHLAGIVTTILEETDVVARAYGCAPSLPVREMMAIGRGAGPFVTSMLQDFRGGRPLEIAALADAVFELAEDVGQAMPVARAIRNLAVAAAEHRSPRSSIAPHSRSAG